MRTWRWADSVGVQAQNLWQECGKLIVLMHKGLGIYLTRSGFFSDSRSEWVVRGPSIIWLCWVVDGYLVLSRSGAPIPPMINNGGFLILKRHSQVLGMKVQHIRIVGKPPLLVQSCSSPISSVSAYSSWASMASSITLTFSYPVIFSPMSQQYWLRPNVYLTLPSRPASFHDRMTISQPVHLQSCHTSSTGRSPHWFSQLFQSILQIRMESRRTAGILQQFRLAVQYGLTCKLCMLSSRVVEIKVDTKVR